MAVRMIAAMWREAPKAGGAGISRPWGPPDAPGEGGHVLGSFRVRGGVTQVGHDFRDEGLDAFLLQAGRGGLQVARTAGRARSRAKGA